MEHCTEDEKTMMRLCAENAALRKQRAELLEALKGISGIACMNFQEDSDIQDIYEISSAAITRAEATE